MKNSDRNTIANIISKLVLGNMTERGMSYQAAKDAAFNTFNSQYPEVLTAYLAAS